MSEGMGSAGGASIDERLLDAADAIIEERGYDALVVDEAMRMAGIEDGVPPDEFELFAAVIERKETVFDEVVAAAVARGKDPAARLLAMIEACVVHYDGWGAWIELWSLALRDDRARELRARLDDKFRAQIAKLIDDGRAGGAFDVDDADQATLAIGTTIDALAVEATLGDDTVLPNFMFGACALLAGRVVGAELRIQDRSVDA